MNKGKREETDAKAMEVYDLCCQGMMKKEIALYLGLHPVHVSRLYKRAKNMIRWKADNIDGKYHLGATFEAFEKQEHMALAKLEGLDSNSAVAVGWAKVAQDARREIKKLLQECGAVFKMPEAIEDGIPFDDPVIRKKYLALREEARVRAIAAGVEQKRLEDKGK